MEETSGGILKLENLTFIASIILVVVSVILIGIILLQPGKSNGMNATSGQSETFYGSGKARGMESIVTKFTVFIAVVFIMASAGMYILPLLQK